MKRGSLMRCYKEQDMINGSPIRVPFMWEKSPGVSKVSVSRKSVKEQTRLPPPPSCVDRRVTPVRMVGDQACSGKPGDPFLAAYIKCTAASPFLIPRTKLSGYKSIKARFAKYLLKLSCKLSGTNVRDDNLLPTPHFPYKTPVRNRK